MDTAFDTRRQACIQHRGRCCDCGSTEHSLRWCTAPFQNVFSLLNPELATYDPDGSVFETWKKKMRNWRRKGPQRRYQGNVWHQTSGNGPSRPHNSGPTLPSKVISLVLCLLPVRQLPKPNLRYLRSLLPYHSHRPQVCVMAPHSQPPTTPTPDSPARLGYNLSPTHDGSKTVLSHP